MFSFSESNSYPMSYHQSPSFTIQEYSSNNISYPQQQNHHHHQEQQKNHHHHQQQQQQNHHHHMPYTSSSNYLPPSLNSSILENPIISNINPMNLSTKSVLESPIEQENINGVSRRNTSAGKAGAVHKKDRHTKISTAQGVRDRRVRLSIGIAREFFNLQEMLGFDKASKTLGWLLTKSKAAIDELASTFKKNNDNTTPSETPKSSSSAISQSINEDQEEQQQQNQVFMMSSGKLSSKKKKASRLRENHHNVEMEVMRRVKARERARERTQKKKMIDHHQMIQNHQRDDEGIMICQSTPQYINSSSYGDESGMIKNKLRGSSSSYHNYNHEFLSPSSKDCQDQSSNNYNDYVTKLALESNGGGGIIRTPGFSTLNIINLSAAIHINAKPWDTSSNQVLQ